MAEPPEPRPSPVDALENYYQGINERKLGKTWKQLTPEKQARGGGFRSYLEWWYTVNAVHIMDIELLSESADQAQVKVELWYGLKNGKASQELKSLVTLHWDEKTESWLLDRSE